jgi:hypothetical protein
MPNAPIPPMLNPATQRRAGIGCAGRRRVVQQTVEPSQNVRI